MPAAVAPPEVYRDVVEQAYRCFHPEKLSDVEMLMERYKGREPDLFDSIVRKYVFMVKPVAEFKLLHAEIVARFDPAKLVDLPRQLDKHKGREAELYRSFCDTYLSRLSPEHARLTLGQGEKVAEKAQIYRGLVEKAYKQWKPEKLSDVDKLMQKYEGREIDLLDQIMRKYVFTVRRPVKEFLPFFAEFLARFAPAKLFDLGRLLQEHRGKEGELLRSLCDDALPCASAVGNMQSTSATKQLEQAQSPMNILFKAGPLGLAFRGAIVIKVVPGEQAATSGIQVGDRLQSIGGETVPRGRTEDQLRDWILAFVKGPRPLEAKFIREDPASIASSGHTQQVKKDCPRGDLSSDTDSDGRLNTSKGSQEVWQDRSAHWAATSDDDSEEPEAIGTYRESQDGVSDNEAYDVNVSTLSSSHKTVQEAEEEKAAKMFAATQADLAIAEESRLKAEAIAKAEERRLGTKANQESHSTTEAQAERENFADETAVRAEKAEADRLEAEETDNAEAVRQAAEVQAKVEAQEKEEAERLAAETVAKAEAERLAAEETSKAEALRLAAEEAEAERLAAEAEAKAEEERLAAEVEAERLAADAEAERLAAKAETERLEAEAERKAKELAAEAERVASEEAEKAEAERSATAKAEEERLAAEAEAEAKAEAERIAAEDIAKAEAERLAAEAQAQAEAEAKAEQERLAAEAAKAEAERLAVEEAAKAEADRLAAEAKAKAEAEEKAEAERLEAEAAAKAQAERLVAEEAAKAEAERLEAEAKAKAEAEEEAEAERLAAEAAAKAEAERLAAEEAAKAEAERLEAEAKAKAEAEEEAEAERLAAEAAAKAEAERVAIEEAAKVEAERLAAEAQAKAEEERLVAEAEAKAEAERRAAEEASKAEAERLASEEAAKAEADRLAEEARMKEEAEAKAVEDSLLAKSVAKDENMDDSDDDLLGNSSPPTLEQLVAQPDEADDDFLDGLGQQDSVMAGGDDSLHAGNTAQHDVEHDDDDLLGGQTMSLEKAMADEDDEDDFL